MADRGQERETQHVFDLLWRRKARVEHLLGDGAADAEEKAEHQADRKVLPLARIARRTRRQCRRDDARVAGLEGRFLLRDLGALQKVFKQALVDGYGPFKLPQPNSRRVIDTRLTGRFPQGPLERSNAGLSQLIFVLDAGGRSPRLRPDGALDVALLRPNIDDQRVRRPVTRQQVGLLL